MQALKRDNAHENRSFTRKININFAELTVLLEGAAILEHSRRNNANQMISGQQKARILAR